MDTRLLNPRRVAVLLAATFAALAIASYVVLYYTKSPVDALLVVLGFSLALVDTSVGMGFGTIGTPVLLISGFSSKNVVPAILLAQLLSAGVGSFVHHRYKNIDLLNFKGKNSKMAISLVGFGVVGAVIGVLLAIRLPSTYVNLYIGTLVVAIGLLILARPKLVFSWARLFGLSIISGFNKALGGSGYGTVATTGLLASGHGIRDSVGVTVFSVAIINMVGFGLYLLTNSISDYVIIAGLGIGAVIGSQIGPRITTRLGSGGGKRLIAATAILLGVLTVATTLIRA